ncbi:ABC transporter permease [Chryseosolibacter indicus]|uniref:ABC transporter permease subunit n=1 Tax=Chryseosolibacter indicus TaxID=2782351 RepID=A0ABS5VP23_9BACT|nr:ABC transporter permease subunit [Chryseosolibacter indicus]MBT1703197.1 ABC transporter permease subunit [Chryseosolibacter indicus]
MTSLIHLLKIDLKKLTSYRTFWIVCGLYFITLAFSTASGMEFLKWLARTFKNFGSELNINRIPLYHFPDVWLNLIYFSGLLKIVLAIMTVISITNEYTYRTLRQNVIDGLSRWEFLLSKILTNVGLSLLSVLMVSVIAFVTGLIYSPELNWRYVFSDMEFLVAYFLEIFAFLSYALMLGVFVQRSGLTIILLLLSHMLEAIVRENVDNYVPQIIPFFPMESISNLVPMPYQRYAFQEIRDYLTFGSIAIALGWTFLFNYFSYAKLKRADI